MTGAGRAELAVGANDWPLPIPLVESDGRWTFDTKAGAQTVVDRRIGRNELSAIRTLLASVDAQRDYFDRAKQGNGTGFYATRLVSTQGHRDGLYWPVGEGESESPLGPLIDAARDAGYPGELVGGKPIPYEGYYFRILKGQGPNGDGGAKSYLHSGRMTRSFALIAWPAVFESTGIMTFIVGPDGDVYQKDLGPETARVASFCPACRPPLDRLPAYLAIHGWTAKDIGFALTIGGTASLVSQVPGGALVDAVRAKRLLVATGVVTIALSILIFRLWPSFPLVAIAEVLQGITGAVLGPGVVAITLGLVGHARLSERLGLNQRFAAAGGVAATLSMAIIVNTHGIRTPFSG